MDALHKLETNFALLQEMNYPTALSQMVHPEEFNRFVTKFREHIELFNRNNDHSEDLGRTALRILLIDVSSLESYIFSIHEQIIRGIASERGYYSLLRTFASSCLVIILLLYAIYQTYKQKRIYSIIGDSTRFMKENPDPVLRVSHNMTIINANPASQSLLRKWETSIGSTVPLEIAEILRRSIKEKSIQKIEERVGEKTYLLSVVYIYDKKYLNLYASNITELRKVQNEVQEKQRLEALGLLAGGIAHDFNNLLTGIINAAQLIEKSVADENEEVIDFSEMILEASDHAADLTKKLLDFSRTDKVDLRPINLEGIIQSTVTILKRSIDKKIKVSFIKEAEETNIYADRGGIQRILLNMGINASHAMPNGGSLTFRVQKVFLDEEYCRINNNGISPGEYCKIEVEDTGVGIPSDSIKKIFDPFFTTRDFGKGSGLGLSSAYGIIKQHNGFIHVYSEEYEGTVFHIYIPCMRKESTVIELDELITGEGRILLVDDEYLVRETTASLLSSLGYTVVTACNGMEAIELYQKEEKGFDLVIVDMIMPGLTGREVAQELKKIDRNCRVLLSSGFPKDNDFNISKDSNLEGFIKKPFRDYQISRVIHEIINSKIERK